MTQELLHQIKHITFRSRDMCLVIKCSHVYFAYYLWTCITSLQFNHTNKAYLSVLDFLIGVGHNFCCCYKIWFCVKCKHFGVICAAASIYRLGLIAFAPQAGLFIVSVRLQRKTPAACVYGLIGICVQQRSTHSDLLVWWFEMY